MADIEVENPSSAQPGQRRRAPLSAPAVVVIAVVLLIGGLAVALTRGGGGHTIRGSMDLADVQVTRPGEPCTGSGGYSDVAPGAPVIVRNGAGDTIATSELELGRSIGEDGKIERDGQNVTQTFGAVEGCRFTFTIDDVPNSKFYAVEVSHRGALTYSKKQMEERAWKVSLTLGD